MYCGWTKWAKIGKKKQFMEAKLFASKNNNYHFFFKIYLNKVDVLEAHIDICTFFYLKHCAILRMFCGLVCFGFPDRRKTFTNNIDIFSTLTNSKFNY